MEMKSNLLNMALCLSLVCLVCSGLLGGVYALTAEPIARTNAEILKTSIAQVLPEGGEISDAMPLEVGGQSTVVGFGGPLVLMVGITPDGQIFNTSVLSHNETPGLGAKCVSDVHFMDQFKGFDTKSRNLSVKKDGGDVDAITASTITSRAYSLAISNAVNALGNIIGE